MRMAPPSLADTAPAPVPAPDSSSIFTVHPDIMQTHILTRLDPPALASASCVSSQLYSLAADETLWTNIYNSTWPSTSTPRLCHVISSFPKGARSFFSDSITNPDIATSSSPNLNLNLPSELISAVDIYYQDRHIFGKVIKTETFDGSPFRIDLLDPEDSVPTGLKQPFNEGMGSELSEYFRLSWILIDPIGRRAMNLSSYKPVTVERWRFTTGKARMRYACVFSTGEDELIDCEIMVTCKGSQSGEMHLSKVRLLVQDMSEKQLCGKDGLVILLKGMVGTRVIVRGREEEAKRRYKTRLKIRAEKIQLTSELGMRPWRLVESLFVAYRVFVFLLILGYLFSWGGLIPPLF